MIATLKKAEFTEGPWSAEFGDVSRIRDHAGRTVAFIQGLARDAEEVDANTHLIAASPEMYEALEAFNITEGRIISETAAGFLIMVPKDAIRKAAAATRKARGVCSRPALAAGSRRAETAQQAQCEASQSGAAKTAQRPTSVTLPSSDKERE